MCEYNRSRHKEVLQNEKPPQNQKGTVLLPADTPFLLRSVWITFSCSARLVLLRVVLYFYTFSLFQSVYGLQNDIRTHSPTHTPAPEAKQPTEEELQEQVRPTGGALPMKTKPKTPWWLVNYANCSLLWFQITFWQLQLDRHRLKMSKVAERWAMFFVSLFSLAIDLFVEPLNELTWHESKSSDDLEEWLALDTAFSWY